MAIITQEYKVIQSSDDARDVGGASDYSHSFDNILLGYQTNRTNGIRIANLVLPAISVISAKLYFAEFNTPVGGNGYSRIWYEDADNPDTMSMSRIPSSLTKSSSYVDKTWNTGDWVTAVLGTYVDYVDVTDLINEVLLRPGWVSGNSVLFLEVKRSVSAPLNVCSYDYLRTYGLDYSPKLVVQYAADSSFTIQPQDITVDVGNTATFTSVFNGYGTITYQWYKNYEAINGATSASYTTPATTQVDDGALFYCIATDDNGESRSDIAELSVSINSLVYAESVKRFRIPKGGVDISWAKGSRFARVDVTRVDDPFPILPASSDDFLTGEFYVYDDESQYVKSISVQEFINEPQSGISVTRANVIMENTLQRFTQGYDSIIGEYIAPSRPMRVSLGFNISGVEYLVPQMYGLSSYPEENSKTREVRITCGDFIDYLADAYVTSDTIYQNKRSDEIIRDLLTNPESPEAKLQYPDSYLSFDEGLNTVSFVYAKKGTRIMDLIKKICEAEEATFYQGQDGLIYFQTRDNLPTTSEHIFDGSEISVTDDSTVPIINRCKVKATVREVQASQTVFTLAYPLEIPDGETTILWADTTDDNDEMGVPVSSFGTIAKTANTQSDGGGSNISGSVTVTAETFVSRIKFSITNSSGSDGYLTALTIQGTPASIVQTIEEENENDASITDYGVREYVIDNDYVTSSTWADTISQSIVDKYGRVLGDRLGVKIESPCLPTLAVRDKITVSYDSGDVDYRIISIDNRLDQSSGLKSIIRARLIKNET